MYELVYSFLKPSFGLNSYSNRPAQTNEAPIQISGSSGSLFSKLPMVSAVIGVIKVTKDKRLADTRLSK